MPNELMIKLQHFFEADVRVKREMYVMAPPNACEAVDEESIKKANKFQVTLSIWSTIFLTLWLAFGFYIITATDYYDDYYEIISFPYPIFAFFVTFTTGLDFLVIISISPVLSNFS